MELDRDGTDGATSASEISPPNREEGELDNVLKLLAHLQESRICKARGHGRRVASMVARLAVDCGIEERELVSLHHAALLHDIGKATLPEEILTKPQGYLSEGERLLLELHPKVGAVMAHSVFYDKAAGDIIAVHHEAFDGSGYPGKLRGSDIPIGGRILAVCNRFDHLLIDEANATAASIDEALELLKRDVRELLDPEVVEKFVESALEWVREAIQGSIFIPLKLLRPDMMLASDVMNTSGVRTLRAGTKVYQKLIEKLQKDKLIDPAASPMAILLDSLPRREKDGVVRNTSEHQPVAANRNSNETPDRPLVVVVDDEFNVVNALHRELRHAGYRVKAFTCSLDALFYIRKERGNCDDDDIFAIITDYNMPGMRGDNFLHNVQVECPDLPCIVLTGMATQDTVISLARAANIRKIIPKPWDKEVLLEVLAGLQQ